MALAEIDIEWIVREVVRRLREIDAGHRATTQDAATPIAADELTVEERLVTLDSLQNRLSGIRRLRVPDRAIVTPAVIDELKDRGISIQRGTQAKVATPSGKSNGQAQPTSRHPWVYVADDGVDAAALKRLLGEKIAITQSTAKDAIAAIAEITNHTTGGGSVVLITGAPSAAVVAANRDPHTRAAVGFNFPAVRQAVDEANANLLAIDPRGRSASQLAGLIQEFLNR